jgi:hypothetical protein
VGLSYTNLKLKHRTVRDDLPETTSLRIHRGLSWLKAAEAADDLDSRFILLWIAFNSIYARDFDARDTFGEKGLLNQFLGRLVRLDQKDLLFSVVWKNYADKIRLFIDNEYITRWYWDFHNGRLGEEEWKTSFSRSKKEALQALANKDTTIFCTILFDRLYVLRNQLMHGGATWQSDVNRAQVEGGTRILETVVPSMIYILLENKTEDWGQPCFPPVEVVR